MSIQLSYDSLGSDGLREIFERGLSEIISNIEDPNTDWKKARKLTVEVNFKPNEQRNFAEMTYGVKVSSAPVKPVSVTSMVDRDKKTGESRLFIPEIGTNPAQMELPVNVTPISAAGGRKE